MRPPIANLTLAVERFATALHDYQSSTTRMNQALARLTAHNHSFCQSLQRIAAVTSPTLGRQSN